jgi:large subunit ribosomal protein L2
MYLSKLKKKEYSLLSRKKKNAGRNNHGRITVAHQGGGHSQNYRNVEFLGNFSSGIVTNFEYDPNRTAFLAKICFIKNNKKFFHYVLAPQNLQVLDPLFNTTTDFTKIIDPEEITSTKYIGSCYFLSELSVGDSIYSVEITPTKGAKFVRAGGTFAIILQKTDEFVLIKMPSGELRKVSTKCKAFLGALANDTHNKII